MIKFETTLEVRWADADANRHVRHSAYFDYCAHARIRFFKKIGFMSKQFEALALGPILFKEECTFIRELRPDDEITINILKGEINEDASRWVLHHEIFNQHGVKCAQVTSQGAWMDTNKRKLTAPPKALADAIHNLPLGDYYKYKKSKK